MLAGTGIRQTTLVMRVHLSSSFTNVGGPDAYFVNYDLVSKTVPVVCKSVNFLEDDESLVTAHRLFEKVLGINVAIKCATMSVQDAIEWGNALRGALPS